jgi:hypothetical protein
VRPIVLVPAALSTERADAMRAASLTVLFRGLGRAEIDWDQPGHSPYDRTRAEL